MKKTIATLLTLGTIAAPSLDTIINKTQTTDLTPASIVEAVLSPAEVYAEQNKLTWFDESRELFTDGKWRTVTAQYWRIDQIYEKAAPYNRDGAIPGMRFIDEDDLMPKTKTYRVAAEDQDVTPIGWGEFRKNQPEGQFHMEFYNKQPWSAPLREWLDDIGVGSKAVMDFILSLKTEEGNYEEKVMLYNTPHKSGRAFLYFGDRESDGIYIVPVKNFVNGVRSDLACEQIYKDIKAGKYKK
jgi:hypothetical protein